MTGRKRMDTQNSIRRFFLDNLWRKSIGLSEVTLNKKAPRRDWKNVIEDHSWSHEFEQFMKNRLSFGYYRYEANKLEDGTHASKIPGAVIKSCIKRLRTYQKDKNLEHLIDVANLCMIEFRHPSYKDTHMTHIDEHNNNI